MTKAQDKKLKLNVGKLYEHLEKTADFNSINEQYRSDTFTGTFVDTEEFSGKYGTTFRYSFQTDDGNNWSLLSNSVIIQKVILEIPAGTRCEVYKNEKGHWRIMPFAEE